jgi:hypothetical protein
LCNFLAVALIKGVFDRFTGDQILEFAEYEMVSLHKVQRFRVQRFRVPGFSGSKLGSSGIKTTRNPEPLNLRQIFLYKKLGT